MISFRVATGIIHPKFAFPLARTDLTGTKAKPKIKTHVGSVRCKPSYRIVSLICAR